MKEELRDAEEHLEEESSDEESIAAEKSVSKVSKLESKYVKKSARKRNASGKFECEICGKAYTHYDSLTTHKRSHLGELRKQ